MNEVVKGVRIGDIVYFALKENEESPTEFCVLRNVNNGRPKLCGSFINTNLLRYENGALLRIHERNDELRTENAKLRELVEAMPYCMAGKCLECPLCSHFEPAIGDVPECKALPMLYALGIYGDDEDKFGVTPF